LCRKKSDNLWPNINETLEHSLIVRLNTQKVFTRTPQNTDNCRCNQIPHWSIDYQTIC